MIRNLGKWFHPWTVGVVLHRRMVLFWSLALLGSAGPWLLEPTSAAATAQGDTKECTVHHIHDGDTATLECGQGPTSIRFYCIDAPELKQDPWGKRSRDHLAKLMGGTWRERKGNIYPAGRIKVRLRAIEQDKHGRTGGSLNLDLVRDGQELVYDRYCKDGRFKPAERAKMAFWGR